MKFQVIKPLSNEGKFYDNSSPSITVRAGYQSSNFKITSLLNAGIQLERVRASKSFNDVFSNSCSDPEGKLGDETPIVPYAMDKMQVADLERYLNIKFTKAQKEALEAQKQASSEEISSPPTEDKASE